MPGNSRQRRHERRREERLLQDVLDRVPKKYKWDFGSVLLGLGLALAASEYWQPLYWPGVVAVYVGAAFLVLHLWSDDEILRKWPSLVRRSVSLIIIIPALWIWTAQIVFVSAPLDIKTYGSIGNYQPGANVYGVPWNSKMYEDARLDLRNPTDIDYRDIDLTITSDLWIVHSVQISSFLNVSFTDVDSSQPGLSAAWINGTDARNQPLSIPVPKPINLARPSGTRLLCDRLPKHSELKLMLVLVSFNHAIGFRVPDQIFTRKVKPTHVAISGSYKVLGRARPMSTRLSIHPMD